jgi:hypothetical protein
VIPPLPHCKKQTQQQSGLPDIHIVEASFPCDNRGGSYKANNNKNRNSSVMQAFNIHMGRLCGACPLSPLQRRWQQQQPRLEAFPSPSPILLLDQAPLPVCGLRAASVTAIRAEAALGTARALLQAPQAPGHAGSRERPRQRRRGQRPNANSKAT